MFIPATQARYCRSVLTQGEADGARHPRHRRQPYEQRQRNRQEEQEYANLGVKQMEDSVRRDCKTCQPG